MAIGSDPEIGINFTRWGLMTLEDQQLWFKYMQEQWGPDLVGGYGTLCYPKREQDGTQD